MGWGAAVPPGTTAAPSPGAARPASTPGNTEFGFGLPLGLRFCFSELLLVSYFSCTGMMEVRTWTLCQAVCGRGLRHASSTSHGSEGLPSWASLFRDGIPLSQYRQSVFSGLTLRESQSAKQARCSIRQTMQTEAGSIWFSRSARSRDVRSDSGKTQSL